MRTYLRPGVTEAQIAEECLRLMKELGADGFWYHDVPALVQVGSRTTESCSGRDYRPGDVAVGEVDLVTIDVSPSVEGAWGDCARSFLIQSGGSLEPGRVPMELRRGLKAGDHLHARLRELARPDTTFDAAFELLSQEVTAIGFELLDFRGCLGHTMERRLDERRFVTARECVRLGDVGSFSFEPHVRQRGGRFGFKHEEVYTFDGDRLVLI